jgi:hypothetical protein
MLQGKEVSPERRGGGAQRRGERGPYWGDIPCENLQLKGYNRTHMASAIWAEVSCASERELLHRLQASHVAEGGAEHRVRLAKAQALPSGRENRQAGNWQLAGPAVSTISPP